MKKSWEHDYDFIPLIGIKRNYDDGNEDLVSAEFEVEGSSVKVSWHGFLTAVDMFSLPNLIGRKSVSTWEFNFHRILNHYYFTVPFDDKK